MPRLNIISFEQKLHAVVLKDSQNHSFRGVSRLVVIPKSTLFDNLSTMRGDVVQFKNQQIVTDRQMCKDLINIVFNGKSSVRDASNVLSFKHNKILPITNL